MRPKNRNRLTNKSDGGGESGVGGSEPVASYTFYSCIPPLAGSVTHHFICFFCSKLVEGAVA